MATQDDWAGNLASVTPPGRPAHTFTYTPVDLTASYNPPTVAEGATPTGYEYTLDRQLTRILRPDGDTVQFAYDAAGRPQSVVHQQGSLAYAYSPTTGNLASVTAGAEGMSFVYDGSLLTGVTWTGPVAGSVTAGYDDEFRVQDLSVNGDLLAFFDYDGDGLLTEAGDLEIVRDPLNGRIDSTALGVVTTAETYDSFGQWSTRTAAVNGSEIYRAEYTRDALSRIIGLLEVTEGDTTVLAYDYDDAGRLVEVETNGVVTATYVYDDNGNRLSVTRPSGVESGTYDDQDRLLTYAGATYGYTAAGDLRFKAEGTDTTFYRYDALGNLLEMNLPDGTQIEYVVDGFNRRIGKRVNGTLLHGFLYQDQLNPVAELDSVGDVVSSFVYGTRTDVPDYVIKNDTTYRIVADHLGSARLLVNVIDGTIAQRIDYDEFGREVLNANPAFQPFGFAGGLSDSHAGLSRFGARDYDPHSGRWTAKDPVGFGGGSSNLYAYALEDPINNADVDGRQPIANPPSDIPGGPWTWYPNPENSRGGVFRDPAGNEIGWDAPGSHWDRNPAGGGPRQRYDRWGNPVSDRQAHGYRGPRQEPIRRLGNRRTPRFRGGGGVLGVLGLFPLLRDAYWADVCAELFPGTSPWGWLLHWYGAGPPPLGPTA